jgi:hypothetical protein
MAQGPRCDGGTARAPELNSATQEPVRRGRAFLECVPVWGGRHALYAGEFEGR